METTTLIRSVIAEIIDQSEIRTHIIGLGDPNNASAIAIKDINDQTVYIKYKEQIVRSKLEDATLKSLAAKSDWIEYHAIGTTAFDLGILYSQHSGPTNNITNKSTTQHYIYEEAAPYLIGFAGLLLLLSRRKRSNNKIVHMMTLWVLIAVLFTMAATGHAAVCPDQYQAAITKLQQGLFEEAANKFEIIYQDLLAQQVPASHLAMTQYNPRARFFAASFSNRVARRSVTAQ